MQDGLVQRVSWPKSNAIAIADTEQRVSFCFGSTDRHENAAQLDLSEKRALYLMKHLSVVLEEMVEILLVKNNLQPSDFQNKYKLHQFR